MTQAEIEKEAREWVARRVELSGEDEAPNISSSIDKELKIAFIAGAEHAGAKWIKCSERMQEVGAWVLIQGLRYDDATKFWDTPLHAEYIGKEMYRPNTESISGDYEIDYYTDVTHWMPLPPAPETITKYKEQEK